MKLGTDPTFSLPSPLRKSYNPFDSDDDLPDCPASKVENGLTQENSVEFSLEAFDRNLLPFRKKNGDFPWEQGVLVHAGVEESLINVDRSGNKDLFEKDAEFNAGGNVMECIVPELMVYYKESSYQSIKDICIDEGVPPLDKVWVQPEEEIIEAFSALHDLSSKNDDYLDKGQGNRGPVFEGLKSSVEDTCQSDAVMKGSEALARKDSLTRCIASADDLPEAREAVHASADGGPVPESCSTAEERGIDGRVNDAVGSAVSVSMDGLSLRNSDDAVNEGHEMSEKPDMGIKGGDEVSDKVDAASSLVIQTLDLESPFPKASTSDKKEYGINSAKENSHSIMDSGSGATIFPNSVLLHNEEEKKPYVDQKPPETQSMSRNIEGTVGDAAYINLDQHFLRETSFSAAMLPPSSISYTGPIAHTGSLSLRSESSVGSVQSFAFPVLQPEWHGSPVRMEKAPKERLPKQQGWLKILNCCRF